MEVTRTTLAVLSLGGLIAASFWIMRPFLGALIWATMIVVATWPLLVSLQRRLGGRRALAIVMMTIAMLLVFVLPFWVAISTLADYSDAVGAWTKSLQLGLAVAGIPFAGALTMAMLMLCLAQLGPLVVLVPAVAWLFWSGDNLWGTALLIWSVFVGTLDNFLRPFLIKKGADLPLLLIFAGVIGGLVSFGLLGIFVGPVVLAVTFTLLQAWVNEMRDPAVAQGERIPDDVRAP